MGDVTCVNSNLHFEQKITRNHHTNVCSRNYKGTVDYIVYEFVTVIFILPRVRFIGKPFCAYTYTIRTKPTLVVNIKMNGIIRKTLCSPVIKNLFTTTSTTGIASNQLRTLWNDSRRIQITAIASTKLFKHPSVSCNFGYCRHSHTKGTLYRNLFHHFIVI